MGCFGVGLLHSLYDDHCFFYFWVFGSFCLFVCLELTNRMELGFQWEAGTASQAARTSAPVESWAV